MDKKPFFSLVLYLNACCFPSDLSILLNVSVLAWVRRANRSCMFLRDLNSILLVVHALFPYTA